MPCHAKEAMGRGDFGSEVYAPGQDLARHKSVVGLGQIGFERPDLFPQHVSLTLEWLQGKQVGTLSELWQIPTVCWKAAKRIG